MLRLRLLDVLDEGFCYFQIRNAGCLPRLDNKSLRHFARPLVRNWYDGTVGDKGMG